MRKSLHRFWIKEDGAVTVDWVVLSAAIIGIGMVVLTPIAFSTDSVADQTADYIVSTPRGYGN